MHINTDETYNNGYNFPSQVLGLGPLFKMVISLQNISATSLIQGLGILFHFDDKMYSMEKPFISVSKVL